MEFITLQNKDKQRLVNDVVMRPLKVNRDESGVLVETLRKDWNDVYENRPFVMQYYSKTPSGMARDEDVWHYHPTVQEDRFLCIQGAIVVAIADYRSESSTNGLLNLFYMKTEEEPYMLIVPKATLHGFMVVSKNDAILLNYPTALYNPDEEGRIPYAEANIKNSEGTLFSWDQVRKAYSTENNVD